MKHIFALNAFHKLYTLQKTLRQVANTHPWTPKAQHNQQNTYLTSFSESFKCPLALLNITIQHHTTGVIAALLWQCSGPSNLGGTTRLFIPASSNTFTLYLLLISSLVKLKESFRFFPPLCRLPSWHLCLCRTSIGQSAVYQKLLFLKDFQTRRHSRVARPGEARAVCQ